MNSIDRVYHLKYYEDNNYNINVETCFRQDIGGQKVFTEMIASYNENDNDEFQGDGVVYMTKYPNIFLNNSSSAKERKEEMRSALASDGYRVSPEETHEYMEGNTSYGNTVQHLQFLAHDAIYNNRNELNYFKKMLPRQLSESVDGFIQVKNGRI
ncbi:unnamed protein product [Meganyctiphanes norvegica]|uniref:Uncharacterized protein n=1 Tax=Meganyctiphanes norvegica TaxID=48144 RepID=A0AAV2SMT8_MEGNR